MSDSTQFDYFQEIQRVHEALSFVPQRTNHSQARLIGALRAILENDETWAVTADLKKAEEEIDASIELLEETKTNIQTIQQEVPNENQ